ncbi:MAG: shikimate dehydrogenase [Anaerolineae bacterium]|jgi:shikimate dehydrogenase
MINGETRLVGLIGWPVAHSLSPAMHNAAFNVLGLNWRYVPLPVPPTQIERAMRGLVAMGFRGANVTIPHKESVRHLVDRADRSARILGAVNTVVVSQQSAGLPLLEGYNTDSEGFVGALRWGGFEPEASAHAVVVGAGGAARAVVAGMLAHGRGRITVLNRTLARAERLVADLGRRPGDAARLGAGSLFPEDLVASARTADLLINATPVGMTPDVAQSIWPIGLPIPSHLTVCDLVYVPRPTRLLRQARASGARTIDGLGMLVQQGTLAFRLWTHSDLAVEEIAKIMYRACEREGERGCCDF